MATPIDLSAFKLVAGEPLAAAKVTNMMTAVETWSGASIDPAALLQKGATAGQYMGWNGTLWTPTSLPTLVAPTILGPTANDGAASAMNSNTAYLVPIPGVVVPTTISRLGFFVSSGGASGNIDIGVYYSDDEATFTRVVSKGSTATPATGAALVTVGSTVLTPVTGRRWYFAMASSNGVPTFGCALGGNFKYANTVSKASSFPLPATLTSVTTPGAVQPSIYAVV